MYRLTEHNFEQNADTEAQPPLNAGRIGFYVSLFGSPRVFVDGRALPKMRTRKESYLLALLVLNAVHRPIDRHWVANTLWPDVAESAALGNLRRSLGCLREALGAESERIASPTPRTLQLNMSGDACDLLVFDAEIRCGGDLGFAEAAAVYTGPLLLGCREDWVVQPRAVRHRDVLAALQALVRAADARGETTAAADYQRRILDFDPLSETALRALMHRRVAQGDHVAALELFKRFRRRLLRDSNAEPDPETIRLQRQILSLTRRAARPGVAAGLRTLTKTVASERNDSVRARVSLVGRTGACDLVTGLLRTHRLVTLTGAGGIGKTSLARRVLQDTPERFPDGVQWVDLTTLSEPEQIVRAVANVVEATDLPGPATRDAVIQSVKSRRMLLVFDNCEHILAESARLAHDILSTSDHVRILATSREPLRTAGEKVWRVPSLGEVDAAALFDRRAAVARPSYQSNPSTRTAVAQICRRLDGIPLAIEMAAAWVRAMSAPQIAARLDDAFRLMARTDAAEGDLAPRHRTLRATLDWSFSLLTETERFLFGRLSIFCGGWTLDAAEAVCAFAPLLAAEEVLETLVGLVDRSLVVYEEEDGRYRFLDTTRAYAAEIVSPAERTVLQAALARYLVGIAEEAKQHWGTAGELKRLLRLDTELPNIRVALASPLPGALLVERLDLHLPTALLRFWWRRAHLAEGQSYLRSALSRVDSSDMTELRAAALNASGVLSGFQRRHVDADSAYRESLRIRRHLGNERRLVATLYNLGMNLIHLDDRHGAIDALLECESLYRSLGDRERAERCRQERTGLAADGPLPTVDRADILERLEAARRRGDEADEISLCNAMVHGELREGRPDLALIYARRAITIASMVGDQIRVAEQLENFAIVLGSLNRHDTVPRLYAVARKLREQIGCPIIEGNRAAYEFNLAQAHVYLGDPVFEAEWSAGESWPLDQAIAYVMSD